MELDKKKYGLRLDFEVSMYVLLIPKHKWMMMMDL